MEKLYSKLFSLAELVIPIENVEKHIQAFSEAGLALGYFKPLSNLKPQEAGGVDIVNKSLNTISS